MKEVRVSVTEVQQGELVVRVGAREINSRFHGLHSVNPATRGSGPRGGRYRYTAHGQDVYVVLELSNGSRPIVRKTDTAVVLRTAE